MVETPRIGLHFIYGIGPFKGSLHLRNNPTPWHKAIQLASNRFRDSVDPLGDFVAAAAGARAKEIGLTTNTEVYYYKPKGKWFIRTSGSRFGGFNRRGATSSLDGCLVFPVEAATKKQNAVLTASYQNLFYPATWFSSTVVDLLETIHQHMYRTPVHLLSLLHDALMDSGCDDDDVLSVLHNVRAEPEKPETQNDQLTAWHEYNIQRDQWWKEYKLALRLLVHLYDMTRPGVRI